LDFDRIFQIPPNWPESRQNGWNPAVLVDSGRTDQIPASGLLESGDFAGFLQEFPGFWPESIKNGWNLVRQNPAMLSDSSDLRRWSPEFGNRILKFDLRQ
jgi:hypothetical protein